jgi:hypothetical protein
MSLPDQIFKPERYTYQDYLLWKGDWELVNGYPMRWHHHLLKTTNGLVRHLSGKLKINWKKMDQPVIARHFMSWTGS